MYLNGVCVGTVTGITAAVDVTASDTQVIGEWWNTSAMNSISGYLQDLRIYKGVAKYKGGFDVPRPYTPVGIEIWRAVTDTTANNFATLNPLASNYVLNNGNLSASDTNGAWDSSPSTIGVSSGKWYTEMRIDVKGWIFLGATQIYGNVGINPLLDHVGTSAGGKGIGLIYDPSD